MHMSDQDSKKDFSEQQQNQEGSFVTGFTVGLFAGAAGFFLFGTKKGETIRSKINAEWDNAKEQLAQEGVISSSDLSIRDMFASVIASITAVPEAEQKSKKTTHKKTATPKKKRRLFKST